MSVTPASFFDPHTMAGVALIQQFYNISFRMTKVSDARQVFFWF